ncbi:MAG: DNA polymerase III subunit delta [Gammaproteobacteria bacterium]|uniref:DNA polymerase III subunit delta n=1 Tax=Marinomonas TaxID=28253 RepID=UPI000C1E02B2|nr:MULTISPECIES: DNA polymerase III subunit delta [unclassified Marinomonas]MBU1295991.1 DNA polymerase III subunit delta [Gammaproteobacteria bacterium]MBU1468992.1 DNA polymerase III subunit delta [Gammaproteobacteria bacterium]MBU2023647.1 DNA polymerase III subunit delta [Gammaproteobacteria bacterium]MBU2238652.1 DNA polymerase III subunit delta [Gammaproteobacteria bacterium]MBU2320438.1 DNA polymerase III subunit delta [Gammaproteobacteria bacterium]
MKVRADQLESQLKKNLAPIYIISGDEVLLCQEAADSIRKAAQHHNIDERLRFVADAQFDWQDVINENQSLSLFSTRRMFDIQIDKMGEKHSKALAQLSQSLSEDNIILLTLPKIDARTQKAKWFTQLESQGVFVQIWPIDANRLPAWVQQRAQALDLSLTRDAASMICERGEGNLLALSQELEKLALVHGQGVQIDAEKVAESVADSSRYSIYDLSDRLLMGKTKDAMHCLHQLLGEGVEASIILWLFNREIQTLANLLQSMQSSSFKQACQNEKIWDKRVPFYESAMSRHNKVTLPYMQNYLALIDKSIKGLEGPDSEIGFRNLVMMFCGYKPVVTELDLP